MSEYTSEQRFWIKQALTISIAVCVLSLIITSGIVMNNQVAFENGYERGSIVGIESSVWVKIDDPNQN